jgi:hypothetical protein
MFPLRRPRSRPAAPEPRRRLDKLFADPASEGEKRRPREVWRPEWRFAATIGRHATRPGLNAAPISVRLPAFDRAQRGGEQMSRGDWAEWPAAWTIMAAPPAMPTTRQPWRGDTAGAY